jgi:hypothetical protein
LRRALLQSLGARLMAIVRISIESLRLHYASM